MLPIASRAAAALLFIRLKITLGVKVSIAETLSGVGSALAGMGRAVAGYEPMAWTAALDWNSRVRKLREDFGERGAMPKSWADVSQTFLDSLSPEKLRQCEELSRLGMERTAVRQANCRALAHVYSCRECGRPAKAVWSCKSRTCLQCAQRNFDAFFARFKEVDGLIPAAVRSLPGWGWHVFDASFRHDGDEPTQAELRAMVGVIYRTVRRAVRAARREWWDARAGCRLRFNDDGSPMISADGWPVVGAKDGEARELKGWSVVWFPEHWVPDNAARKRGERGAKKKIPACWKLRFGYDLIRDTEFGFDNVNAHFHSAYFGPRLDYWYDNFALKKNHRLVCGGELVNIFKQESGKPVNDKNPARGGLGEESYTIFFERARSGFLSVLAHALKYTRKVPRSTPEGLARLEHVLVGTRRVALMGMHHGVPLKPKKRPLKCPSCSGELERVKNLGLVPLSEVADLPDAVVDPDGSGNFESFDAEGDFGLDFVGVRGP
jgi:hypothetical protein